MRNIDFTIEEDDLMCLHLACKVQGSFNKFEDECKKGYSNYYNRNLDDLQRYCTPKTFSQWVNGQIIALA